MKQDTVVRKWHLWYLIGFGGFVFWIFPLVISKLYTNPQKQASVLWILFFIWILLWTKNPFARQHAKKLYPEKNTGA